MPRLNLTKDTSKVKNGSRTIVKTHCSNGFCSDFAQMDLSQKVRRFRKQQSLLWSISTK